MNIKAIFSELWNRKTKDHYQREVYPNQWWMILITLITLFPLWLTAFHIIFVNLGWLVAGGIGAAAWTYRATIMEEISRAYNSNSD